MTCPICLKDDCRSVKHMVLAKRPPKDPTAKARANHRRYTKSEKGKETRKIVKQRRMAREAASLATLTDAEWQDVLQRFENSCAYCHTEGRLDRDHFIPVSMGGSWTKDNVVPACRKCNTSKKGWHPLEWMTSWADYVRIFNRL